MENGDGGEVGLGGVGWLNQSWVFLDNNFFTHLYQDFK